VRGQLKPPAEDYVPANRRNPPRSLQLAASIARRASRLAKLTTAPGPWAGTGAARRATIAFASLRSRSCAA